jgi:PAP2 superfamily
VMVPRVKRNWAKVVFILYPVGTVIVIVLTGNHYVLDAVGGFAVLGIGYLLARPLTRAGQGPPVPVTS